MKCPLCESCQTSKYGKTSSGVIKFRCDICSNIFLETSSDNKKNHCDYPKINFLRFKKRNLFKKYFIHFKKSFVQVYDLNKNILPNKKDEIFEQIKSSLLKLNSIPLFIQDSTSSRNLVITKNKISTLYRKLISSIIKLRAPLLLMKFLKSTYFIALFFLIGFVINFSFVNIIPFYHQSDVGLFHKWANCFSPTSHEIYSNCDPVPNYPSIGVIASAGTIHIIKSITSLTNVEIVDNIFRAYLFLFDLLNLFLFTKIANMMRFRRPWLIGLVLFLIPSNLAGGSVWGQIDNISLSFCLISSIAMIKSWASLHTSKSNLKTIAWLIITAIILPIFILLKQSSIFSAPYFLVLFIITVIKFWQKHQIKGLGYIFAASVIFCVTLYNFDHIFSVPQGFLGSSYYYVWTGGVSNFGHYISGNGFNIWVFLRPDPSISADEPFSLLWDRDVMLNVRPYNFGITLYLSWMTFLFITTVWAIKTFYKKLFLAFSDNQPRLMAFLFLYYGLSNLGFNVFLTGTHERHMYSGYPFILLGITCFLTQKLIVSWRVIILCFASAFIYGCFVFSVIGPLPGVFFAFRRQEFVASIHLLLLIVLTDNWIQICRTNQLYKV